MITILFQIYLIVLFILIVLSVLAAIFSGKIRAVYKDPDQGFILGFCILMWPCIAIILCIIGFAFICGLPAKAVSKAIRHKLSTGIKYK